MNEMARQNCCNYLGQPTWYNSIVNVWDKRNRLVESRTVANVLLGSYVYNERGLRIKAERMSQPMVLVVEPNGGESLHLGAMNTVSWSGLGLAGGTVKLELLVDGMVAGTIAEGIPGGQTSYQWQAGKMLGGWATTGANYKVRVTAVALPAASGTTYYVYDSGGRLLSEYDGTGTCAKDYLYLGGKMIGEYVPATSSYYYYASDQINSTRMVTDSTGAVVHSAQYDPYGGLYKTWVDAYRPKPEFSGKEKEFGSEMEYFGARYYTHGQYRFITVDPVIEKKEAILLPQLWNLCAYCRNNPINYFDLEGKQSRTPWGLWNVYNSGYNKATFREDLNNFYKFKGFQIEAAIISGSSFGCSIISLATGNPLFTGLSVGIDVLSSIRNNWDLKAISPEIATAGTYLTTEYLNKLFEAFGKEIKIARGKVSGIAGAIVSGITFVNDTVDIFIVPESSSLRAKNESKKDKQ